MPDLGVIGVTVKSNFFSSTNRAVGTPSGNTKSSNLYNATNYQLTVPVGVIKSSNTYSYAYVSLNNSGVLHGKLTPTIEHFSFTSKAQHNPDLIGKIVGYAKINNVIAPDHKVWLYDRETKLLVAVTRTDLTGYFEFNRLPLGLPRYQATIQQEPGDIGSFNVAFFDKLTAT